MRTLFVAMLCGLALTTAQAQTQKIGFADWERIFEQMPQFKQIESELRTHNQQLENQMKAKQQDYQAKVKAYQDLPVGTPEPIKADKVREIQTLEESFQKFQQEAQASLQKKQGDLMAPIMEKIGKAIEEVAKENGYTFIINPQLSGNIDILLYADEQFDISGLVLKKFGITPTPAATNTAPVKKP
ncbi:MAG: OmpH family outer membrane protein [Flammeovirgaceae bacterium]